MINELFKGLFDTSLTTVIPVSDFLICILSCAVLGLIMAIGYMYRTRYTKSFVATLALLPAVVCVVIMMVNGNVGTGVAVAGAFSLVRFRSVPGTAREICALFLAMGTGLIAGMGYIGFAALFSLIMTLLFVLYSRLDMGVSKRNALYKTLTVTVPEDLDYAGVFDGILSRYTSSYETVRVKTVNMGSMYKITYDIVLRERNTEKAMIDALRVRNGNLEVSVSPKETATAEL